MTITADTWFWALAVILPTGVLALPLVWLVWKVRSLEDFMRRKVIHVQSLEHDVGEE